MRIGDEPGVTFAPELALVVLLVVAISADYRKIEIAMPVGVARPKFLDGGTLMI